MVKEFWVKDTHTKSPEKLAKRLAVWAKEYGIRYIPYSEFLLTEYKNICFADEASNVSVLVEFTKFPQYQKGGWLAYLLVCSDDTYRTMRRGLLITGFDSKDLPF